MTAHMDVITREVNTAGMIVQRMEMTFVIGDVIDEKIYGTTTINAVGIGATETKCLIKAFQGIKSNNEKLANLVNTAKDKILAYYTDNCHLVLQDAERMVGMQQYNDALAILVGVPQACEECYTACQTKAVDVYKLLIDHEGKQLIQNARSAWLVKRDYDCAEKALDILAKVEHNRWNVEQLLLRYHPLKQEEQAEFLKIQEIDTFARKNEFKRMKMAHLDICSNKRLREIDKDIWELDRSLVRILPRIYKELNHDKKGYTPKKIFSYCKLKEYENL
jgi:uncharacterized protein YecT (DUF1311 family)